MSLKACSSSHSVTSSVAGAFNLSLKKMRSYSVGRSSFSAVMPTGVLVMMARQPFRCPSTCASWRRATVWSMSYVWLNQDMERVTCHLQTLVFGALFNLGTGEAALPDGLQPMAVVDPPADVRPGHGAGHTVVSSAGVDLQQGRSSSSTRICSGIWHVDLTSRKLFNLSIYMVLLPEGL